MTAADVMRRWKGKDPVEVVGVLEERLAAAHRETQALLRAQRADWTCVFSDGTRLDVNADEFGATLDERMRVPYRKATGLDSYEGKLTAIRSDGKAILHRVYTETT